MNRILCLPAPIISPYFATTAILAVAIFCCSFFIAAPVAHASGLTEPQIQSILNLLSSFDVDTETVGAVDAILHGTTAPAAVRVQSYNLEPQMAPMEDPYLVSAAVNQAGFELGTQVSAVLMAPFQFVTDALTNIFVEAGVGQPAALALSQPQRLPKPGDDMGSSSMRKDPMMGTSTPPRDKDMGTSTRPATLTEEQAAHIAKELQSYGIDKQRIQVALKILTVPPPQDQNHKDDSSQKIGSTTMQKPPRPSDLGSTTRPMPPVRPAPASTSSQLQSSAGSVLQFIADYSDEFNDNLAAVMTAPFAVATDALGDILFPSLQR
jgi:hypothetical protein